jgi:hypothetical protein
MHGHTMKNFVYQNHITLQLELQNNKYTIKLRLQNENMSN